MAKQVTNPTTETTTTPTDSQTVVNKKVYLGSVLNKSEFKAVQKVEKGFAEVKVTTKTFIPPDENMVYLLASDLAAQKTVAGTDDEAPRLVYEKQVVSFPLVTFFQMFAKNILQKSDTKDKKTTFTLSDESLAAQCRDLFFIYNFITPEVYFKKFPTEFLTNELSEDAKLEIAGERVASIGKAQVGTLSLSIKQCLHVPGVNLSSGDTLESLKNLVSQSLKTQLSI